MSEDVLRYQLNGAVALVEMNRPKALNAFNRELRVALLNAVRAASADDAVRAVVLTGAGRAFGAGADLREGLPAGAVLEQQLRDEYCPAVACIASMDKPVIAAVEGFATGVAAAHVLASDLSVMAEDAFLMLPFMNIALVPDGGLSWLLTRRLGHQRAFEVAIEGERLSAARCLELGLINRVVGKGAALAAALAWAEQIAARPRLALARTKSLIRAAAQQSLSEIQALEARHQGECVDSADCREGVAAFLEKRPPVFA
jgi:2-(1,2-epoxy-1,2-dihydrophenyl)acetyl-CoA isomerase